MFEVGQCFQFVMVVLGCFSGCSPGFVFLVSSSLSAVISSCGICYVFWLVLRFSLLFYDIFW